MGITRTHKCETLDRTIQQLAQVDMEALETIFIRTTMSIFTRKETYFQLKSLEITVFPLAGSALGPLKFQRRRNDCCTKQSKLAKIESMEEVGCKTTCRRAPTVGRLKQLRLRNVIPQLFAGCRSESIC